MIRSGTIEDAPRITEMLRDMKSDSRYTEDEFCEDTVLDVIKLCISHNLLSVLVVDDIVQGFAGGIEGTMLFNRNIKTGTELSWWVDYDHRNEGNGIELLTHIEGLARDKGITHWSMVYQLASMPEVVGYIYEKMGYTKNEVVYSRKL